jgi:hypothetical protein
MSFIGRECQDISLYKAHVASILRHVIVVGEHSFRLPTLLGFPSLSFLICFLQIMKALEHNVFLCPFVTHLGFCAFGLDLGSFFFLPFPL